MIERLVADVLPRLSLDEALTAALEDERTQEQFERALNNPAVERLALTAAESRLAAEIADRLLANPQVRAALARQTAGFAEELVAALRRQAEKVDDRTSRGTPPDEGIRYGGIATRGIALVTDAALAQIIVLVAAGVIALVSSIVGGIGSNWLVAALLGAGWFLVVGAYFVFFWTTVGQTPGLNMMQLRVVDGRGEPPSLGRSIVRMIGLALAIIPVFAGFLPVLFDRHRRALPDYLAGTVVIADQS